MDEKTAAPKKPNLIVRILAFLVTLVLLGGAVFLVANRDTVNLDALKRRINYHSLSRSDTGQVSPFFCGGSSSDVFVPLGDDLLLCWAGGVRLYSPSGVCYVDHPLVLDVPAVVTNGDTAAVWSVGGSTVYLYRDRSQLTTLEGFEGSILSVRINSAGWLAVTTRESGSKATVSVYNDRLNKLMDFRLSGVADAVVTGDCQSLAALVLGEADMAFETTLALYPLGSAQAGVHYDLTASDSFSLGNNVILDLREKGPVWFVGDAGACVYSGNDVHLWDSDGTFLKGYAFADEYTAMLVGKYRAGSQADLVTVDALGQPSPSRTITEQVLSLSAAGRYTAVLTAEQLVIYTGALDPYNTLDDTQGVQQVLMRADGTAWLIGSGTAQLYIPG